MGGFSLPVPALLKPSPGQGLDHSVLERRQEIELLLLGASRQVLGVGEECRRSRKDYQILFYLFTRNLGTEKCQEISDLFLQVLGGSQNSYPVLPRSLSLTFTIGTLQGDPLNSIYYLKTKTAVAVKKKKERKKEISPVSRAP